MFGASPALCECWTVLLPRAAKISNFSPAATPFLSRLVHPCSHPASPRSGFSSRVPPGPERGASWTVCLPPQEPQASQHERFWLFFPTTRGSPRRNFLIPLLKWDLKKWRVRCLTNISLVERVSCLTASLWPKRLCYDSGSTTCNSTVSQSSPSQTMCRCLGKDEQAG